ncbi:MAG: DNA glycosylase [Candidatus Micrarchaeia archaeon]
MSISFIAKDFNMQYTIESAQPLTFFADYSFSEASGKISYILDEGDIKIESEQKDGDCLIQGESNNYSNKEIKAEIKKRFDLDLNLKNIYSKITNDKFIEAAVKEFHGLRITRNGIWETSLSFITSEFNNIKRIRKIMKGLINRWSYLPNSNSISSLSIQELNALGFGFRSAYIKNFAKSYDEELFKSYGRLNYADAKNELMKYDGIGDKVSDCILLMGYGKLEAFPIDTWVKRVMINYYFNRDVGLTELHNFAEMKWGNYAGYAQQYLFWYGRSTALSSMAKRL